MLGGGRNVFLADLQALLEAAAHQAAPDHLGLEAGLQRFRPDTLALQGFGQLVGRQPHPLAHSGIGLIDIAGGRVDAEALGFLDLHLFVDQFVEDFLPGICLRVVRKLSLVRCSISRLVMGSPPTMQATTAPAVVKRRPPRGKRDGAAGDQG